MVSKGWLSAAPYRAGGHPKDINCNHSKGGKYGGSAYAFVYAFDCIASALVHVTLVVDGTEME